MEFFVKIADISIKMKTLFPETKKRFQDYECSEKICPEMVIETTLEDIIKECQEGRDQRAEYLEILALLRKLGEQLPEAECMLVHGAAVAYRNRGYLFAAPSGTGKSTHILLWRKFLGNNVKIINGDKPVLSFRKENEILICGSPWAGKEGWQKNRMVPLASICILRQGTTNQIIRISGKTAVEALIRQTYLPEDTKAMEKTLELLNRLFDKIPIYYLECDMSEQAVKISFEKMTGFIFEKEKVN